MADFKIVTSDFVNVVLSTSRNDVSFSEKRFPKDILVSDLKAKLELITAASCQTMQLEAYDKDDKKICTLSNDNAMLGSYPIENGMRLHIIDQFALRTELDFGNVEKFTLPDEQYEKLSNSVKSFMVKNKMGKYNEENQQKKEKQEAEEKRIVEATEIGARCKVSVPNAPTRLGTVMYKGQVEGLPVSGYFIGVKYDEPLGKNDGSVKGKRYFDCPPNYGAFVKPQHVLTGDYPEEDYDLNEEI